IVPGFIVPGFIVPGFIVPRFGDPRFGDTVPVLPEGLGVEARELFAADTLFASETFFEEAAFPGSAFGEFFAGFPLGCSLPALSREPPSPEVAESSRTNRAIITTIKIKSATRATLVPLPMFPSKSFLLFFHRAEVFLTGYFLTSYS